MSKPEELSQFLETASPSQIILRWKETLGKKNADAAFYSLFSSKSQHPMRVWDPRKKSTNRINQLVLALVFWLRVRYWDFIHARRTAAVKASVIAWRSHYRLGPSPVLQPDQSKVRLLLDIQKYLDTL
jgi:hypothetical protein